MPKREADRYLTDRLVGESKGRKHDKLMKVMLAQHKTRNADENEADEDEELEVSGESPFKQASVQEIAKRPMRGLPGRKTGTASLAPASSPASAPSTSFSFGNSPSGPFSSFTSFGTPSIPSTSSTSAPEIPKSSFPRPSVNGSSTVIGGPSSGAKSSLIATASQGDQDPQIAYYANLRGLNLSVIPPLQRLCDTDPFMDLSHALTKILSRYREERLKIEDEHSESTASKNLSSTSASSGPIPKTSESINKPNSITNAAVGAASKQFNGFSFGATTSPSIVPSQPSIAPVTSLSAAAAPSKPFAGFSFSTAPMTAAPAHPPPSTITGSKPFSGFSFGTPSVGSPSLALSAVQNSSNTPKASFEQSTKATLPPPPANFTFAGSVFKPDSNREVNSASASPSTSGSTFVFNPKKANEGEEKSSFSFPAASAPSTSSGSTVEKKDGSSAQIPEETKKSVSDPGLGIGASPFMPAGNSRARQPSPLRQVETVPELEQKDQNKVVPPKTFAGFSFGVPASSSSSSFSSSIPTESGTSSTMTKVIPPTPPRTISFGSSGSPKAGAGFSFGTVNTSPKAFNPSTSTGFSFASGSNSSSAANLVNKSSSTASVSPSSFGFGTKSVISASTPGPSSGSGSGPTPGSAFSGFSWKPPATNIESVSMTPVPSASANGTPAPEGGIGEDAPPIVDASDNPLLSGGAGEEDEETLYEARAKLWKHESKTATGPKEFVEHGISIIKLKKHEATDKIRMLARSDANGRVQINFGLFSDLNLKVEKSFVTFMGFEGTTPTLFRLKLRNAELAGKFKEAVAAELGKQ